MLQFLFIRIENNVGKGENDLPTRFSTLSLSIAIIAAKFNMSSANALNLDQAKNV